MKILYALNSGNPGGVEQHVLDLTKGLIAKGHEVFVVCPYGPITNWYTDAGAHVFNLELGLEIDPVYIFRLVAIVKREQIEVVHAHELKAGVNALLAAAIAGVKVRITHIHTPMSEWRVGNPLKKIYTGAEIFIYKTLVNLFASKEIALTVSRKQIKIKEGIAPDKIVVIPNGLDINLFTLDNNTRASYRENILKKYKVPENKIVIGNVGRMTEEKGHEVLIRAFQNVMKNPKYSDRVYLMLVGGGKLESRNRAMIKSMNLENSVTITGIFDRFDLIKYYASFDLFVFPSLAEGFGIVLVEAMSLGIPTISSDLEVLQEVGGGYSTYFRTGNAGDLAYKTIEMLEDLDHHKANAREFGRKNVLDNYSMDKFVQSYIRLYESINAGQTRVV